MNSLAIEKVQQENDFFLIFTNSISFRVVSYWGAPLADDFYFLAVRKDATVAAVRMDAIMATDAIAGML